MSPPLPLIPPPLPSGHYICRGRDDGPRALQHQRGLDDAGLRVQLPGRLQPQGQGLGVLPLQRHGSAGLQLPLVTIPCSQPLLPLQEEVLTYK